MNWALLSFALWIAYSPEASTHGLEIEASVSGYNLLWPSERCCSFALHVTSDGNATLRIQNSTGPRPTERTSHFHLTAEQLTSVEDVVVATAFFDLPKIVGTTAIDGDMRNVRIRQPGGQWHEVEVGESALNSTRPSAENRAASVWRAIRDLVRVPELTVR